MDDQLFHHIVDTLDELAHYLLNDVWANLVILQVEELLHISTVAKLNKDIVSVVRLDGLPHSHNMVASYEILVLNFTCYQGFLVQL